MNTNRSVDKKEFKVSYYGASVSFEWYSMEAILKELENNKSCFGKIVKMEKATKAGIREYYKKNNENLGKHARFFAYIKFFSINGNSYGIVAGKTNYNNPDLLFDRKNGEKDKRFARTILENLNSVVWDETIIIVNHKSSVSEEADKQEALFIECYLQRKFNLFDS